MPSSTIALPANNSYYTSLTTLSGSSSDNFSVGSVQASIKNTTDTEWWNGSTWVTTSEQWLGATGTTTWTYVSPSWTSGKNYLVRSKVTDSAGNVETPGAGS